MHRLQTLLLTVTLLPRLATAQTASVAARSPVLMSEFIAERPPTPSAHASSLVETRTGMLAAWFGGTREGAPDVGIWAARKVAGVWIAPVELANGLQEDGTRFACYNPVLFHSADGVLHLFYKVGPSPARWWGMHMESRDEGATWTRPLRLPDGLIGPVKNKPAVLDDGTIVAGSSTESATAPSAWRVHFEISHDNARTWLRVTPAPAAGGPEIDAIQPSVLRHASGALEAIGRTRSGRLFETWSADAGKTWSALALTSLPNPNAGTDAVTLQDGRQLLVYNHSVTDRSPLNVAISRDGRRWENMIALEDAPGEYSYPAVIQTADGLVHITYTWRRERIKHVVLDPATL